MSVIPGELVELDGGRLVLPTNADPAGAGHQKIGFRRLAVGLDVGGRGDDPSALVIIRAESRPYMTGRGWQQALTPPDYVVVYSETARLDEATDVVEWVGQKLQKLKNWHLTFDATGLGAPLTSMFHAAKIPALSVSITAGATFSRKGNLARVSKQVLFENAAVCLQNGTLRIAGGLPEREKQALMSEIQSVEYAETSAGNLTLKAGGRGHHADRFSALTLALIGETHFQPARFETAQLAGYWG
ncbi:hypothetical protein [Roseinatronobacter sp. S2]|uniref:hypothetical protein n=1 Tax=Roseinatronobacter sp. S2 TaxID=3035471 RepID=UPI00240EA8EA|nr:hypothetical protein [Roseinatronobacter sp. S2]WFE74249.1 hypothetical protein P8S53_13815 [Roseinatronobacter sp. S2]